jgi:Lon protease-like protein
MSVDGGSRPYLVGHVDYLDDAVGDSRDAETLVAAVGVMLRHYVDRMSAAQAIQINLPDIPEDPRLMSYLVAAALATDTAERQTLLAAPDAVARLRFERRLLNRELRLLERVTSIPTNELTKTNLCPN